MADEIIEETQTEGTTEIPSEGTTGNGYLTKPYLVRNLQTFWSKIKEYIKNQKFVNEDTVKGALLSKAEASALKDLETTVTDKVSQAELTERLAGKVDAEQGKGLSDNNFTDVLKTKLENLKDSVVTNSDSGLMSADDKKKLDELADKAVTLVDTELKSDSENPVQNAVIYAALDGKVDKENPLDPFNVVGKDLSCAGNSNGDIIFTLHDSTKHFKMHAETGEVIECFYLSFNDSDSNEINFDSFGGNTRSIAIPNPDGNGVLEKHKNYKFYVECFELSGSGKYEPFILKVKRGGETPEELTVSVFKS